MVSPRIKFLREKNNLSIDYVSIQMEISVNDYKKIEKGLVDLKISKLDLLSKIFKTEKSEFFKLDCTI